jgi:hypothetical protein
METRSADASVLSCVAGLQCIHREGDQTEGETRRSFN